MDYLVFLEGINDMEEMIINNNVDKTNKRRTTKMDEQELMAMGEALDTFSQIDTVPAQGVIISQTELKQKMINKCYVALEGKLSAVEISYIAQALQAIASLDRNEINRGVDNTEIKLY